MDELGYYRSTPVFSSHHAEYVYVSTRMVPENATIIALIHTHYKHNDTIIFTEMELPNDYDNYVIDIGGCVYYAPAGAKHYEAEQIVWGNCR